ncbi:MAG: hypothetical protein ABFD50_13910 [Smithella sp.]
MWYEIDAEGYVIRNVWFDYDKDGQIIQQTATVRDYSVNFTTGNAGFNNGTRYHFLSDILSQDMSNAIRNNKTILREETYCKNGQSCQLITLYETFTEPVQNPGEPQAFSGSGCQVWIDQQTGQQIRTQSFWLLSDGSEAITSTKSTILVEKLDNALQDILDILERVIVP